MSGLWYGVLVTDHHVAIGGSSYTGPQVYFEQASCTGLNCWWLLPHWRLQTVMERMALSLIVDALSPGDRCRTCEVSRWSSKPTSVLLWVGRLHSSTATRDNCEVLSEIQLADPPISSYVLSTAESSLYVPGSCDWNSRRTMLLRYCSYSLGEGHNRTLRVDTCTCAVTGADCELGGSPACVTVMWSVHRPSVFRTLLLFVSPPNKDVMLYLYGANNPERSLTSHSKLTNIVKNRTRSFQPAAQ